jgi:hypothetical protein
VPHGGDRRVPRALAVGCPGTGQAALLKAARRLIGEGRARPGTAAPMAYRL